MKTLVIIPGGFHPFHTGHYSLYSAAEKRFPGADIFIAATNDTSDRPFPFAIKERLAKLAGIPAGHFVQVKSPFQAKEITQQYDPASTVLIFVRSEKDRGESPQPGKVKKDGTPGYLQAYKPDGAIDTMDQHGYMDYLPTIEFSGGITSASEIRAGWPNLDEKRKTVLVLSMYPATQKNPKLAKTVVGLLDTAIGAPIDETSLADMRAELALMDRDRPIRSGPIFKSRGEFEQYAKKQRELADKEEIVKQMTNRKPVTAWPHGRTLDEAGLSAQSEGVAEGGENFNGIDISMEIQKDDEYVDDEDYDNQVLYVTASSKGKELGHVLFAFDGEYLMPQDLEVEERYRGQGIAQIMYDYVKSKGYKIRRSGQQTDAGAGFWDKHKPGKNVWEQGVAENFADGKGPGRPGDSVRHGIPKHATMAELEKASHAKGRKGQLARWQLNMRRGHKK